jgi:Suppressor of forked protein (Suf)
MSKDPRRRENGGQNIPPPPPPPPPPGSASSLSGEVKQSILFGDADEEDVMDIDEAIPDSTTIAPPPHVTANILTSATPAGTASIGLHNELITKIITPSPYTHHNSGPTSSRFRNALNRVTSSPTSDVEAWQALITEANACYRNISNVHAVDTDIYPRLDWIESCYGALLKNFPYAATHYVTIIEMLMTQSARFGEENGPQFDYGMDISRRSLLCEAKIEHLFRMTIGIEMNCTIIDDNIHYGMCVWMVELWMLFIRKVERDAKRFAASLPPDDRDKYIREATTKAYESAIVQAGFSHNNQLIWKKYVEYVKSWLHTSNSNNDHTFAQQQMVHLRSVYQRLVMNPMTGLDQLWQEYEAFERGQSEALAQALISEFTPKYQNARTCYLERNRVYSSVDLQLGRLATPPVEETDEDYAAKIEEEYILLKLWKMRCSYERTNPLRLEPQELSKRIRHTFKEMICILTRHPESWHMWSTWELYGSDSRKAEKSIGVLQLGQEHIPDCTLLAFAEAQVVEMHTECKENCIKVMERFLDRCPNTLGFVLYQKMVRRYRGKDEARLVFAKARRILSVNVISSKDTVEDKAKAETTTSTADPDGGGDKEHSGGNKDDAGVHRHMVTNRLESAIGISIPEKSEHLFAQENGHSAVVSKTEQTPSPGLITWYLYAAHAIIEHRLNRCPDIAARVYELGLRKHSSFITIPPYVLRYAQLLLELNDTMNLRALLTRSVAACEALDSKVSLAAMWDMNLYFESIINGSEPAGVASIQNIERRRREALMGPEIEDVGTGGYVGVEETALIGAQKSTIAEQLIRTEGYDVSSRIVNGLNRTVDFLGVMGLWGDGDFDSAKSRVRAKYAATAKENEEIISGGRSDATYQKRLNYQILMHSGLPSETAILDGTGTAGTKTLSARERLQQGAGASAAGSGQGTAIMLAIQQSPEWLRQLLLLLPASKLRLPIVAKPPPHLTEMALSQLRQNTLPAERPADLTTDASKRVFSGGDGNSSDDDDGDKTGGSGYSSTFRARQRARMIENGTNQIN